MAENHVTARLQRLINHSGLGLDAIAKRARYKGASSIQRYLSAAAYKKQWLSRDVAERFANALEGQGDPPISRDEVLALAGVVAAPDEPHIDGLQYAGILEASAWRPVDMLVQATERTVPFARDPRYPAARQYAWEVRGDSMNKAQIFEGFIVRGVDLIDFQEHYGDLRDGMIVVVERTRGGGMEIELTVKQLRLFADRMELFPRSTNPKHTPLVVPFDNNADNGETVTVKAIVTASFTVFDTL